MNKPELIAPVSASEALYFINKPFQARTDEDGWRKEAAQAAVAANTEAWEKALRDKATDALVHGQFRKAAFFQEFAPVMPVQEAPVRQTVMIEGRALEVLDAMDQGTQNLGWVGNTTA